MKMLFSVFACLFLLSACEDENAHKTVDWYKQHQDVLKADVEKCNGISPQNWENWCEAADQADRELIGQRIGDHAREAIERDRHSH